tara:strand:- start:1 stop:225 length:225 start_codon:yes stop_codon:yes gene_type:complete
MNPDAEYIETVTVGDERVPCARFLVLVPLTDVADLNAADLASGTQPSAAVARVVARPIAAETQRAVAAGVLVLP